MTDTLPHHRPGSAPHGAPEDLYASPPPWDIGRPQPAFLALAEAGTVRGRVLDAGCGTGEHTLMAARLGLDATGIDLAPKALRIADQKARDRGITARFLRHDARRLPDLRESFDTVLDSGLFHIFDDHDRTAYVASLHSALRPGGRYFMLGFSDQQQGQWGPVRKLAQDDIRAAFADGWQIDSITASTIEITTDPAGIRAWLAALTRTARNAMLTAEARIQTRRPSRYLTQLCKHASDMGGHQGHRLRARHAGGASERGPESSPEMQHVEWSDTHGIVRLAWGQCTLQASSDTLTLRAEAADAQSLRRIQDLITARLERFGQRDHLKVDWQQQLSQ